MAAALEFMKKNSMVSWTTKDGKHGFGKIVVMDEANGSAFVAVHSWDSANTPPIPLPEQELEVHPVIYCTLTWLTPVS